MGHVLSDPTKAKKSRRLDHIDGLRGIAALAVVVHHNDLIPGIDLGRYGVLVFFIISGYVVPFSLSAAHSRPLAAFALSRLFRLYPAYWLSMALALALGQTVPLSHLLVNLTMAQRFLAVPDLLGVYWTLAVELLFYFGCAALFLAGILDRRNALVNLAVLLTLATAGAAAIRLAIGWPAPFAWLGFFSLMVGGAALRRFDLEGRCLSWRAYGVIAVLVTIQAAAMAAVYADPAHDRSGMGEAMIWGMAAVTFLAFRALPNLMPPGSARLGRISYSLYLLHNPVGLMAAGVVGVAGAVGATASIAMSIGAAYLCWAVLEQPCIRIGHRLIARMER